MDLLKQSESTRKVSTSREERIAKRRGKFPVVSGFAAEVEVPTLGGSVSVTQSASQGGYFIEYMDPQGFAHAVPVEAIAAAGCTLPKAEG